MNDKIRVEDTGFEVDREEFDWWCNEYPELSRQEILDILDYCEIEQINNQKGNLDDVTLEQLEQRNETWQKLTRFFK